MRRFWSASARLLAAGWLAVASLLLGPSAGSQAAGAAVNVVLSWSYDGVPAEMSVYEADATRPFKLWEMEAVADLALVPKGAPLTEGRTRLAPDGRTRLVLVFHNPTPRPLYFFAAPHHMTPANATLGFKFHCLCLDQIYRVPAGQYWYRAVELTAGPAFRSDQPMRVEHVLVGVDAARAREASEARRQAH